MRQKRIQQIEQRIDRIKRALLEIGPMRPGSLTRQYKDPQHHTGAYWQIRERWSHRAADTLTSYGRCWNPSLGINAVIAAAYERPRSES